MGGSPSDLPGVTGVGGTEFCGGMFGGSPVGCYYAGAAGANVQQAPWFSGQNAVEYPVEAGVSLEGTWNDSNIQYGPSAGGGGASTIFAKPSYQQGVAGMPNDGVRDVPDISLTASPNNMGYLVWEDNQLPDGGTGDVLGPIGGTSAATPSFAGILALVNQAVAAKGGALGLGNVNPQLYALFAGNATNGAFHDIVTGDNIIPCDPTDPTDYPDCPVPDGGIPDGGEDGGVLSSYGGYKATVGYDLATGLGTVDAQKLVAAWTGLVPTTTALTAPAAATVGGTVTLSATVTSSSASATSAVGGSVTFSFRTLAGDSGSPYATVDAGGGYDESWILGTVAAAGTGSPEKATASLTTAIPPGLYGQTYLVAEYTGDAHYLASNSPLGSFVSVTGSTLTVTPATITLPPNGQTTFATSGGAPGVSWGQIGVDTTCLFETNGNEVCSAVESLTPTTAAFQAGGHAGTITIVATDTLGEEAIVHVTVAGTPVDAGTGLPVVDDAGPPGGPGNPPISGSTGGVDSGVDASVPGLGASDGRS